MSSECKILEAPSQSPPAPIQPLDIAAMTRGMVRGDEQSFRDFHGAYFDRLLRYVLALTRGNEDAAREALQLTFMRVARYIKKFDCEDIFWNWLRVIARTAMVDEARKQKRYFAFLERFRISREIQNQSSTNDANEANLRELMEKELSLLPLDEQQLIEQKYFMHCSVREIAREQETTEKAVESRLSRIRRRLKESVLTRLRNEPRD